jgi:hypothetical protein
VLDNRGETLKGSFLVTTLLLSVNCFAGQKAEKPVSTAQGITYCELAKNPSSFMRKRIRVRAIYSYMFEVSRLKAPECCPGRDFPIWVEFSEEVKGSSKRLLRRFPKAGSVLATFEGLLEGTGPYGDGGYQFKFTVDRIENLEHKTNPSPANRPEWMPNCEISSHSVSPGG